MTLRWFFGNPRQGDKESVEKILLPPGLQIHPIQQGLKPTNQPLTLLISSLVFAFISALSAYLAVLNKRIDILPMQDHPRTIGLLLYEEGDGHLPGHIQPSGGGIVQKSLKPSGMDYPSALTALSAHLDPTEPEFSQSTLSDKRHESTQELLSLQPGLLPMTIPGNGNGIGSGIGSAIGNGRGSGLGQRNGSTWIHSARGDEELKVAVNFLDIHDYISPEYPEEAKARRISGDVVIAVTIDTKGNPIKYSVVEGEPLLAEATLKVFPRWHFVPITYKGEKVGASFEVRIRFTLIKPY